MITVNGERVRHREGMTVEEALNAAKLAFQLVLVRLDGQLVPRSAQATTLVRDGAELEVIPLLSGG